MPIYEYACSKCGKKVELLRFLSQQDDPVECPHCGAPCEFVLSTPNHHFTGPDFYATEYGTCTGAKFGRSQQEP